MNTIEQTRDEFLTVERITKKRDRPGGAGVHYHNGFEVYYLIEGTCWYFIDKKSYHLTAGDIALIPRGVLHKTAYETDVYTRLLVYCDESFIPPSVLEVVCAIGYFAHADEHAAEVAHMLAQVGVRAFWNFTSTEIQDLEPACTVETVHLGDSLMTLCYRLRSNGEEV